MLLTFAFQLKYFSNLNIVNTKIKNGILSVFKNQNSLFVYLINQTFSIK